MTITESELYVMLHGSPSEQRAANEIIALRAELESLRGKAELVELDTLIAHSSLGPKCCGCLNVKKITDREWLVYCNECGEEIAAAGSRRILDAPPEVPCKK